MIRILLNSMYQIGGGGGGGGGGEDGGSDAGSASVIAKRHLESMAARTPHP